MDFTASKRDSKRIDLNAPPCQEHACQNQTQLNWTTMTLSIEDLGEIDEIIGQWWWCRTIALLVLAQIAAKSAD